MRVPLQNDGSIVQTTTENAHKNPQPWISPRIFLSVIQYAVSNLLGTTVPEDAPLMDAGLDSLGATELISVLSEQTSMEIESTALFDHPTV